MSDDATTLRTERLELRACRADDAAAVVELAGDRLVAETTLRIPHPYSIDDARAWIATHAERRGSGTGLDFAITLRADGTLLGSIGLERARAHDHAEMGYWIGVPHWSRGYATEAARAVVEHAFGTLRLHRVHAHCFTRNPASGRVLEKIGMRREGTLREHVHKGGRYETLDLYGVLRTEFAG